MNNYRTVFFTVFLTIYLSSATYPFIRARRAQQVISIDRQSDSDTPGTRSDLAFDASRLRDVTASVDLLLAQGQTLPKLRELKDTPQTVYIEGFDADRVIAIIKDAKEALNAGIEKKEFRGLRAYVDKFYVIPTYDSLERVGRTRDRRTLITQRSKVAAFENPRRVIKTIRNIASADRLAIDLRINSQPEESANYDMWPSGGQHRTTVTNNTLDNVYRGYYTYRVTKTGYKTIEEPLNLVDSDGRSLDCTMNKNSDADGPHPCKHH